MSTHSPAGVSEYEVQASPLQLPPTLHCRQQQCTVCCIERCSSRPCSLRWRVRECSSALLGSSPRAKVQAASCHQHFSTLTSDLAGGRGRSALPSQLNVARIGRRALFVGTSRDDGSRAGFLGWKRFEVGSRNFNLARWPAGLGKASWLAPQQSPALPHISDAAELSWLAKSLCRCRECRMPMLAGVLSGCSKWPSLRPVLLLGVNVQIQRTHTALPAPVPL